MTDGLMIGCYQDAIAQTINEFYASLCFGNEGKMAVRPE